MKTLADPSAAEIHFDDFSVSDVAALAKMVAPVWGNHTARSAQERTVYEVNAVLVGAKLEDDRDLHVVIADPKDLSRTMIVEIPHPDCMAGAPQWTIDAVAKTRAKYLSLMRVGAKFKRFKTPIKAALRGVLFFDKLHGQTGVAKNGVELHPLLRLEVL